MRKRIEKMKRANWMRDEKGKKKKEREGRERNNKREKVRDLE